MAVYNPIQYDARVIRAAEALDSMGEKIVVISCNSDSNFKNPNFESIVYQSKHKGAISLLSFWFFVIKTAIKNRKKIKLFYMHDYYLAFLGRILSKFMNKKWIYDAHELLIERKGYKYSLRECIFLLLDKKAIKKTDLVVAANDERKKILVSVYNLNNVISVLNIPPPYEKENIEKMGKKDIIVYQGYMAEDRHVSYFINILKYLPPHIRLKLIGTGPEISYYKELAEKTGLTDRILFTGLIPNSEIKKESKYCKLGIVYYKMNGLNNLYCSPNKVYEYAQLGIPMLVSPQPFLQKIITKYNIGEVLDINVPVEKNAESIINIMKNYTYYQKGMKQFLSDFTYQNEVEKLKEAIKKII